MVDIATNEISTYLLEYLEPLVIFLTICKIRNSPVPEHDFREKWLTLSAHVISIRHQCRNDDVNTLFGLLIMYVSITYVLLRVNLSAASL